MQRTRHSSTLLAHQHMEAMGGQRTWRETASSQSRRSSSLLAHQHMEAEGGRGRPEDMERNCVVAEPALVLINVPTHGGRGRPEDMDRNCVAAELALVIITRARNTWRPKEAVGGRGRPEDMDRTASSQSRHWH
jgi:hypothetical protein